MTCRRNVFLKDLWCTFFYYFAHRLKVLKDDIGVKYGYHSQKVMKERFKANTTFKARN